MLNPFFLQGSAGEQSLVQSLINEQLRMYGVEVYYIPRRYITTNTIIKEVIESKFDNALPLEAYVDTYEGYEGQGTILSKFGIQPLSDLTLIISKERYETYITPLIKNIPDIELATRPKEGDLIYFPLGDRLFEIKFVEHEKPFYQLQKTYVYELRCELFRYEDEEIDTGVEQIDDNVEKSGYIESLSLIGSGSTATAIAGIVNGGVRFITINNRGEKYTSIPRVAISSAPAGGLTAVGVASMIAGLVDCNGTTSSKVQRVDIINSGYGYTTPPSVAFFGGGGVGAAATATIGDGVVGIVTLTSGGSGYSTVPTIIFSSPSGIGVTATAVAYLNSVGIVTQIGITNAGLGYTISPTITISSPYISGIGNYIFNETITGSSSGTTAKVKSWNASTSILQISNITGSFVNGETITGSESGAVYQYRKISISNADDSYAQNTTIENEADNIIDFTDKNPFGMP
jgi:hypothetical protein